VLDLVATDTELCLLDESGGQLRRLDLSSGRITTLAGDPQGGQPLNAFALAVADGVVYLQQARRVTAFDVASGQLSRFAGTGEDRPVGEEGPAVEDGPADQVALDPVGLAVDGRTLYVSDAVEFERPRLRAIDLDSRRVETVAGRADDGDLRPAPLPGTAPQPLAGIRVPAGPVRVEGEVVYVRDNRGGPALAYDLAAGTVTALTAPFEPSSGGDGGSARLARIAFPRGTATDGRRLWVGDSAGPSVREVDLATGMIRTLTADVLAPVGLTYADATLYVADAFAVRAVDVGSGRTRAVAGAGTQPTPEQEADPAQNGDGGPATQALLTATSTALLGDELYIGGHTVRVVDLNSGVISTVPDIGRATGGFSSRAPITGRFHVTAADDMLFVADVYGHRVLAVDLESGRVQPVAGSGQSGDAGDDGPALDAQLDEPTGLAVAGSRLLIADRENYRVRVVDLETGTITAVAGTGEYGFGGEGGEPTAAQLARPEAVASGPDGRVWIADTGNHRVRAIDSAAVVPERLSGPDRYATAAAISAAAWGPGVPLAFVVSGEVFHDALVAGPYAADQGGPVLLTTRDALPDTTARELRRLRPARLVVVGDEGAVSATVLRELKAFTDGDVTRLAGADPFTTGALVARTFVERPQTAYATTAAAFPDGLVGGVLAAGNALLFVAPDDATTPTLDELRRAQPAPAVVFGGRAAVSDRVAAQLADVATRVERISGPTRYETAAAIAREVDSDGTTVFIATGENFPDALAAVPLAVANGSVILLVQRNAIPEATKRELERLRPARIVVLGGPAAIADETLRALGSYLTAR
jgi:putative cell wall-binding protein